jgi:hypothetical protein
MSMASTYHFELRVFNCSIQVETACIEVHAVLQRYIFPSLPRIANTAGKPDISIRVIQVADQFQLLADDVAVASAHEAIHLVPDLIRTLDDAVVQRLSTVRAVHAGAVLWGERALLLPGSTHAGKSSLVTELLRRGATYLSDEYALIDSEGLVHPYPRALLVRSGRPEQVPMLPAECNATVADTPYPVGWILSLQYLPGCSWDVTAVTQSEALLILLRNTPHVLAESPSMVQVFERAVRGAICCTGHRNEATDAVDHILRLMSSEGI